MKMASMEMKLALCLEWLTPVIKRIRSLSNGDKESLEYAFRTAKQLGYDGMEMALHPFAHLEDGHGRTYSREFGPYLTVFDLAKDAQLQGDIAALAEEVGLEIVGSHWLYSDPDVPQLGLKAPVFHYGLPHLPHITSDDEDRRQMGADYSMAAGDFTSGIGGRIEVIGSPGQTNYADGKPQLTGTEYMAAMNYACDTFVGRGVVSHAEENELVLCLEPLAALVRDGERNVWTTSKEVIRFNTRVGSRYFSFILDVKAMMDEAEGRNLGSVEEVIATLPEGKVPEHFHANYRKIRPGLDIHRYVKMDRVLGALDARGYFNGTRWVSVEPFVPTEDEASVPNIRVIDARQAQHYMRAAYSMIQE